MKITILLHGPWNNCITKKIIEYLKEIYQSLSNIELEMVIVSYVGDMEELEACLKEIGEIEYPIRVVQVKDLFNPGFYNINRQIYTVHIGLKNVASDRFVVKLRNDQIVNFKKLFYLLRRLKFFRELEQKFLTTNCYTRKDRLYHPSDMFLCGWRNDLLQYYSAPLMAETSAEWKMKMLHVLETEPENFRVHFRTPESYLFTYYLESEGWKLKGTEEDSYQAIRTYFYVANSWDIDYCWNKARVPGRKAGNLILPISGNCRPFGWDTPIRDNTGEFYWESVSCYERSDFTQKRTKKDAYYVELAKRLFAAQQKGK